MACELHPGTCRREHIAPRLADAIRDGTDFEARCPLCGHPTFRISAADYRSYRNVWTCACKPRHCDAHSLRVALLGLDVKPGCLGIYDGAVPREIRPEAARKMELAIRDILAVPHLRPADIRIHLAESLGMMVPGEVNDFVKFAMAAGVSRRRAYEAADRWCRPSDGHPPAGDGVVDTSRSTDPSEAVKSPSQEACDRAETAQLGGRNGTDSGVDGRAVSAQDRDESTFKPAA